MGKIGRGSFWPPPPTSEVGLTFLFQITKKTTAKQQHQQNHKTKQKNTNAWLHNKAIYCISSNKCSQHLLNFETARRTTYYRVVLISNLGK